MKPPDTGSDGRGEEGVTRLINWYLSSYHHGDL